MAEINLGRVIGEQGERGLQGIQGPQGAKGDKGDKGERGDIGPRGLQGEKGAQGLTGINGAAGFVGPQGPQGPQGIPGRDGQNGATGSQGPIGLTGLIGPKGDRGLSGYDGSSVSIMHLGEFIISSSSAGGIGSFSSMQTVFLYIVNVLINNDESVSFNFYNSQIDGVSGYDLIQTQEKSLSSSAIGVRFNANGEVQVLTTNTDGIVYVFGIGY